MGASGRSAFIVAASALAFMAVAQTASRATDLMVPPSGKNDGMRRYVDRAYGFWFWYPRPLAVTVYDENDALSFPGGVMVETLHVGQGTVSLHVVRSPQSTITDEAIGHAAPIPQTKYFYDAAAGRWMVAYPEGTDGGGSGAPKPADISKSTVGGLPMLPAGARFDTTIIPLSTTLFVVVQDGGGSAFTNELAATVAAADAPIDAKALVAALKAEAAGWRKQEQQTISPATLCALRGSPSCRP